ncbi:MAG: hypothetical protein HFH48_08090 [Lachnospiraceae bacterium]|nr:hypothetical protein [Lachnospiraceae bacterium]
METKQVPIMITLIAGFVTCIIGFMTQMETKQFVKIWIIVLISFYILGCIAKIVLDKNFKEETEEATEEAAENEESEELKMEEGMADAEDAVDSGDLEDSAEKEEIE